MTKQKQSGEKDEELKELENWSAGTYETEPVPLIDEGRGKTIAIRAFTFKMNPEMMKKYVSKQELFNAHAKQLSTILWGDGLRPYEGSSPRVIINKKKNIYQILVPCEARLGVVFPDRPKNLTQELMKNGKLDSHKSSATSRDTK